MFIWLAYFLLNLHNKWFDMLEGINWFLEVHLMTALLFTHLTNLFKGDWLDWSALFTSFLFEKFQINRIVMFFFYGILSLKQILHLFVGVCGFMTPLRIHHLKRLMKTIFLLFLLMPNDISCCFSVKIRFKYIFIYFLTFISFFKVGIAANICRRCFDELWIWLIW
jgi:hypothetical protein